jgi:hypothetical protein
MLGALVLLALATGCTHNLLEKESAATAAGFQLITPVKPAQVAQLTSLPKDKVTLTTYQGRSYYILPDLKHNRAYVGGAKEYQIYKQIRIKQKISDENLEAAEANSEAAQMNQMTAEDWGAWDGWGAGPWLGGEMINEARPAPSRR